MRLREYEPLKRSSLKESHPMMTALVVFKKALLGLAGMMAFSAVGVSATVPHFLRSDAAQANPKDARLTVTTVSRSSVIAAPAARSHVAEKAKSDSPAHKTTKGKMDQRVAQANLAQTGCKDHAPGSGAPAVAGGKSSSRKTYTNSTQEKSLCNPESPRSR